MDKEFLRQIEQANELLTQLAPEKLSDEILICECFCVNVRDIRQTCANSSEVDLGKLKHKFSMGEGCQSCVKTAPEWMNKIFQFGKEITMAFDRLLFGTAGVPNSTAKKNNPVEGVKRIHELALDCMQLEFAHGVRMKEEVSSAVA